MRVLLGAGRLLKNFKCRIRWYSTDKTFLPPNDVCEKPRGAMEARAKRALEARSRRITHLTRQKLDNAKEPETPTQDILYRAWASSSGSSSSRSESKEPKAEKSADAQQGKCPTNQSLGNKSPKVPLIPLENIKQDPELQLDRANSDKLEIVSCKIIHEDSSGEDLETLDLKLDNCKDWQPKESVLKQPAAPKEEPHKPGKSDCIEQLKVTQKEPQVTDKPSGKGVQEQAKSACSQKSEESPQNLTDAATSPTASPCPSFKNTCKDYKQGNDKKSKDASLKKSSCAKENVKVEEKKEGSSNKPEVKESEQKKPPTKGYLKETSQKCANLKIDKSKADSQVKPSQDVAAEPKEEKGKKEDPPKAASQSQPPSLPTSSFSFPLLSAFPSGRNPCRDGPRGGREEQVKETKVNQCMKFNPCINKKTLKTQEKPKEKANKTSDCAKSEKTPKTTEEMKPSTDDPKSATGLKPPESVPKQPIKEAVKASEKEIKPSTDHPKCAAGLKQSESVPKEPVKEAVKASEKVISEAQKAPAAVTNKGELRDAPKKVETEAQKAPAAVTNKEELKDAPKQVETKAQKSKEPMKKVPPKGADTSKGPKKSIALQKFPAAPLKRTITAYLDSIEPLLTPKEFKKEVKLAEEFEGKEGQKLQELLEKEAESCANWLTPRWTRAVYLTYQAPVTASTSPALSFPLQKFKEPTDCLFFAARAIRAIYEFKKLVDEDKVPAAKMGDNVLDNSQFINIFGTVRKPGRFCDTIEQYCDSDFVVVVYQNNYFQLPILSPSGSPLSAQSLVNQLEAIIKWPLNEGEPIGLLTHDNRDNWAEAYGTLSCLPGNAETLDAIEQSLFVVCLDKSVPVPKGQEYIVQAHQLLHGGGIEQNSANRWMDKTIQLIVNPIGLAGFCYEQSPAECQPVAMLLDYVADKIESDSQCETESKESSDNSNPARHLKFHPVDDCINMWLHVAVRNIMRIACGLRMNVFQYECHGNKFIQAQGLNSDSYIQMAIQLAYYNLHKTLPAQYETAHLRMFIDGRTETIRSTSNESKAFVLAMNSGKVSDVEKIKALQKAVDFHGELTKRALKGEGIDRHLFGLQQMAAENGLPIPEFFRSKGFVRSVSFQLYTSQVATSHNSFMAYGPQTSDGYGCCYNPQEDKITFAISGWSTSQTVNPEAYGKAIKKSLDTMRRLIVTTGGDRVGENPCRCKLI